MRPPAKASAGPWLSVAVLSLTAVISYTDRQALSLVVDPVRAELRLDDGQMSLLLGLAFAFVYGLAGLPAGWLADRAPRRNLICGGLLVWSAGALACGLAHDFAGLFAARLTVGLGEAVLSPAAVSLLSDAFPPQKRGLAVGTYFTGIAVGVGGSIFIAGEVLQAVRAGLLAATPLAALAPWRQVFLVVGAATLVWTPVLFLVREPMREGRGEAGAVAATPGRSRAGLAPLAAIYAAVAIASLVDNAVGAWAPSLLIRRFGLGQEAVGLQLGLGLMLGYGGGMLAGGLAADAVRRLRGPYGKMELCLVAAAAVVPAALLLDASSSVLVLAGTPLYFALSAVVTAAGLSAILDATPPHLRGRATAASFLLNVALGAGLGPSAVTLAAAAVFPGRSLGPPLALVAASAYGVAALALLAGRLALRGASAGTGGRGP